MRARAATVAMLRPLATKPENFDQVRTLTRFFFTLTSSPLQGVGSSSRETNLGGLYSVASKAIWFHETPTIPTYSILRVPYLEESALATTKLIITKMMDIRQSSWADSSWQIWVKIQQYKE